MPAHASLVVCSLMVVMNSSASLLITYSKHNGEFAYDPNTAVFMAELAKFVMATILWANSMRGMESVQPSMKVTDFDGLLAQTWQIFRFAIPALCFNIHNNLQFESLRLLDAPTFTLFNNCKIITTAIFFRFLLSKSLSGLQWIAVVLLAAGMAVTQLDRLQTQATEMSASRVRGLSLMLCMCAVGSAANVYNEFLLKKVEQSLHLQNMKLYLWGCFFCYLRFLFVGIQTDFFAGYSAVTCAIILCNAFTGQFTSFVLKYADNMVNRFANATTVLFTAVASSFLFEFRMTPPFYLGVIVVLAAFLLYFAPSDILVKMDKELVFFCVPTQTSQILPG